MFRLNKAGVFGLLLCACLAANGSVPLGAPKKSASGQKDLYGCMLSNAYYIVNFAAYQMDPAQQQANPPKAPVAECIDIPRAGVTQITLDLLDRDVRHKPVQLTITREDGHVLAETARAVVKQGVITTTVDFRSPGRYKAVLYVDDEDLRIAAETGALHMPITVGLAPSGASPTRGITVLIAILAVVIVLSLLLLPRWLSATKTPSEPAA